MYSLRAENKTYNTGISYFSSRDLYTMLSLEGVTTILLTLSFSISLIFLSLWRGVIIFNEGLKFVFHFKFHVIHLDNLRVSNAGVELLELPQRQKPVHILIKRLKHLFSLPSTQTKLCLSELEIQTYILSI